MPECHPLCSAWPQEQHFTPQERTRCSGCKADFEGWRFSPALGASGVAPQLLASDKTFLISDFSLLEMAQRDCSLQLPALLMCYNKNNVTPLTASLVRLLFTLEN